MKYIILTYLFITAFVCSGQSIILEKNGEYQEVTLFSEKINGQVSYECSFDLVYQLDSNGWTIDEASDYFHNGYVAYYYIREGFTFEWVDENINFHEDFYPTLYHVGCEGYTYSE